MCSERPEGESLHDDRRRVHPRRPEAPARDAGQGARRPDARATAHGARRPPEGEHARVGLLALRADRGQRGALSAPEAPADRVGGRRVRREARTAAGGSGHGHVDGGSPSAPPQGTSAIQGVRAEGLGQHRRLSREDHPSRPGGDRHREAPRRDAGHPRARPDLPLPRHDPRRRDRAGANADRRGPGHRRLIDSDCARPHSFAMNKTRTVGELRSSGYQPRSVKQELRDNLIARLRKGEAIFPGIVGYEESVLPQIENAILSGQDIVFLGERGQAKTRMARLLIELLDDEVPGLAGCEINDNPFAPICQACRERVAERGDKAEIAWIPRDRRYGEKLATPDITIADLIGEVDPIKVAEGRYLGDELTIHYGLVPRTNRGIFALNELPDLAERIQVGLLNIMEERDVQIRGYKVRLAIDVYVVASANPEDYTNRGRIITPLKDRFGSQVRTHYPRRVADEIAIMEAERTAFPADGVRTTTPEYMKQVVAELTHLARKATEISQRSGVSVRVSICNYENLVSSALKRAIRLGEADAAPRVSDLGALVASTAGKIELETLGDTSEEKILGKLVQRAVLNVFNRSLTPAELDPVVAAFQGGLSVQVSDAMPSAEYVRQAEQTPALRAAAQKLGGDGASGLAAAVEFVLEGLHLSRKLNKDSQAGQTRYRS